MRIDVKHVADLARMRLSPEEAAGLEKDLRNILDHIERLSEVDVEGVEPTFGPKESNGVRLDKDVSRPGLHRDAVLDFAPDTRDGYYLVPKEASQKTGDASEERGRR